MPVAARNIIGKDIKITKIRGQFIERKGYDIIATFHPAALLHNPDILLLDEPLSGLDVTTTLVFKDILTRLAAMGKIIIYSSHILEVVEKICSRVIIINRGKIVADDSVSHLSRLMSLPSLESIFKELVRQEDTVEVARSIIAFMKAG